MEIQTINLAETKYSQKEVLVVDAALSNESCKQLINYFLKNESIPYNKREVVRLNNDAAVYHIAKEVEALVNIKFPHLEIDWCHIVRWPLFSSQDSHLDDASDKTTYTSITYLNDGYKGGETYIDGIKINNSDLTKFDEKFLITPKKASTVCFDGNYFSHGVNTVSVDYRYTLSIWYKDRNVSSLNSLSQMLSTNKYLLVKNAIDKEKCANLTSQFKEHLLHTSYKDIQCPKSEAVYGTTFFDSLLLELLPTFEDIVGESLYPTYSYARFYVPEEKLPIHIDRPSCEVSATLTLGFEGNVWPIYMGDAGGANAAQIEMDVGDAVLYFGAEKYHWRNIYTEGAWQAQVFLHYVRAGGPHAEWRFDKRPNLNLDWAGEQN